MNQEKQYSDPLPRRLSSDPRKQETDWTDERPDFAAQAELIRHVQAASPPPPLPAIQRKPIPAALRSPSSSVAQFTLADAQELWQRWYVLAAVPPGEEKIRAYIEAGKRGWRMLRDAWFKPQKEVETEEMGERVGGSGKLDVVEEDEEMIEGGGSERMDVIEEDEEIVEGGMDIDTAPEVDEEDKESIEKKMETTPLDTAQKLKTDMRRYEEVAKLIEYSKSYGEARIALNLFFHKNAPLGYNSHSGATPVYEVKYERDYTFGKPSPDSSSSSPFLPLRTNTEYFRTSSQHPHIFRKEMNALLKKKYGDDVEAGNKKIYLSFNVNIEEDGSRLQIISGKWSYENSFLLGGRKDNSPRTVKVTIGKNELVLWVNTLTAGHGSLYNAAGIVPNMIQFEQIKEELKLGEGPYVAEVDSEAPLELASRSFHAATRRSVLSDETGEQGLAGKYKAKLLMDRRVLVEEVSRTINAGFRGKYVYAVVNEKKTDFLQYPCLVLEPVQGDWPNPKTPVDDLKGILVESIHTGFDISLANRPSFGFAYPTVGDVGVSVRIWPGLIPAPLFRQLISKACNHLYTLAHPNVSSSSSVSSVPPVVPVTLPSLSVPSGGTSSPSPSLASAPQPFPLISPPSTPYVPQSPLEMALITARMRARERFKRYDENKSALKQDQTLRYMYKWVNNRIVSNLIKANKLILLLAKKPSDTTIVNRAVRVLENLNEYDLIQASAEEELLKAVYKGSEKRPKDMTDRLQNTVPSQMGSYGLLSVKILSSGMEAYRVAVETIGGVPKEGNCLYFEAKKLVKPLSHTGPSYGEVTRMQDPSYNFVDRKDAASDKHYQWPETISSGSRQPFIYDRGRYFFRDLPKRDGLPIVHLYDITNTSLDATFILVKREFPDMVVCFESLSKHFQLGMDKTTLGRLIVYVKDTSRDMANAGNFPALITLEQQFVSIPDTPLPDFFLNYIEMQSQFFGV